MLNNCTQVAHNDGGSGDVEPPDAAVAAEPDVQPGEGGAALVAEPRQRGSRALARHVYEGETSIVVKVSIICNTRNTILRENASYNLQ